ncbi:hypothetical protein M3Y99_00742900 [Aphelenchoides fujianensis]|nr:hypothetical protein M3Y99_00742900 [Aphelenchoides fujianensis]
MADDDFDRAVAEGVPSEGQIAAYSTAQQVLLASNVLTAALSTFVILKASPPMMATYKWLLLNQVGWNLAFDLLLCLSHPVVVFPAFCGFSASSFLRNRSHAWMRWDTTMIMSCAFGTMASCFIAHRTDSNYKEDRQVLEARSPALRSLFQTENSFVCLTNNEREQTVLVASASLSVLCGILCLLVALFNTGLILQRRKASLSVNTYRLQVMLLKSCAAQIVGVLIAIVLPLIFIWTVALFRIDRFNHWILVAVIVFSLHATIDAVVMLLTIRSYRQFLLAFVRPKTRVQIMRSAPSISGGVVRQTTTNFRPPVLPLAPQAMIPR